MATVPNDLTVAEAAVTRTRWLLRGQPRVPAALPIAVVHPTGRFAAQTLDLGVGGMFIATTAVLAYGTKVEITLELPDVGYTLRLAGVVRWKSVYGLGVQFLQLGVRDTHAIVTLLGSVTR